MVKRTEKNKTKQLDISFESPDETCRLLIENVNDAIIISQNEYFIFYNSQFARLLGYSFDELKKINFRKVYTDQGIQILEQRQKLREAGKSVPARYETVFVKKDGSEVHVEANVKIVEFQGDPATFAVIRDITDRKKTERELAAKEQRYQTLFSLSPSGILLENLEGTIIDANPAFCKALGYDRSELIGKSIHMLAHPDAADDVAENLQKLLDGQVLKHRAKSVRKDGSVCYMDLNECKIRLPDNSLGIMCVAKDVSDQIKAEAERIIKEKMTGIVEIAGAVCHELNQPMTVISVTCDLLLMNTFDKAEIRQKLTTIKSQLDRMTKLTKKLMHLTRYETREYLNGTKIVDIDRASE